MDIKLDGGSYEMKTRLMRVPDDFHRTIKRLKKKRGYKTGTEFLKAEGTRLFDNADCVTDMFDFFGKRRKKRKQ